LAIKGNSFHKAAQMGGLFTQSTGVFLDKSGFFPIMKQMKEGVK